MGVTAASMTAGAAGAAGSAAATLPLHNIFVYGSLLADEVVNALLKRVPTCSPATLNGYDRYSIKGRVYPAILPAEGKKTYGRVILGVTDAELYILDTFEDEEYKRNTVEVFLNDDSEKLLAETYVWGDKDDQNLFGEWDFELEVTSVPSYHAEMEAAAHEGFPRNDGRLRPGIGTSGVENTSGDL
ncbi:AIG2-like protein [Platanthera guangdongensis]|uniref:Putative gamma-glutamylcyclotransferase n=1 Tax=Platanthera guangdongensis TaxID=2320717 RepID=A0ABR2MX30_9ASPA